MKTLEETKQELTAEMIRKAEWEVKYYEEKLAEAELNLKAVREIIEK